MRSNTVESGKPMEEKPTMTVEITDESLLPDELCTTTVTMSADLWRAVAEHVAACCETGEFDGEFYRLMPTRAPSLSLIQAELEQACDACGGSDRRSVPGARLVEVTPTVKRRTESPPPDLLRYIRAAEAIGVSFSLGVDGVKAHLPESSALTNAREALTELAGDDCPGCSYPDPNVPRSMWCTSHIAKSALAALDAEPAPVETRNSVALRSLVEYCESHPDERLWQALRNWSKWQFILAAHDRAGATLDTFGIEGLDGTAEKAEEASRG